MVSPPMSLRRKWNIGPKTGGDTNEISVIALPSFHLPKLDFTPFITLFYS
jgi:hypothetical protein